MTNLGAMRELGCSDIDAVIDQQQPVDGLQHRQQGLTSPDHAARRPRALAELEAAHAAGHRLTRNLYDAVGVSDPVGHQDQAQSFIMLTDAVHHRYGSRAELAANGQPRSGRLDPLLVDRALLEVFILRADRVHVVAAPLEDHPARDDAHLEAMVLVGVAEAAWAADIDEVLDPV